MSLSVFLSSGTLSCWQRDLRMFFIYKLCGVKNEFEKKLNEPWFLKLLLKWRICKKLEQVTDCLLNYNWSTLLEDYSHLCFYLQENLNKLAWFILCERIKSGKKKSIQYLSLKKTNLVKVIPLKKNLLHNFP